MNPTKNDDEGTPSVTQVAAEARDLLSATWGALDAALAPFQPVVESLRELMIAAEPRLRAFALGLMQTTELFEHWERQAPTVLKDSISSHGLIIPLSQMSFPDLVALLALHRDGGEAAVVRRIGGLYDEIFGAAGFLDDLEATWAAHPILKRRATLLRETLEAHRLRMFGVSIPTLIAQFEGLVADATNHRGEMNGPILRSHIANLTARESVTGGMFSSFVNDALLAQFQHGCVVPPFSRHAILHGGDIDYATEMNSRTAILLIDNMRELIDP